MKYLILLLVLLGTIGLSSGCSDDNDSGNKSPLNTSYNPTAPDEDDRTLNEPPPTTVRYPSISGNGILWKPVSDSTGKLAVLLNPSYGKPSVSIKNSRNQVVAIGEFVYYSNPNKATYRFPRPGSSYSGGYLIVGSKVFSIGNGGARQE